MRRLTALLVALLLLLGLAGCGSGEAAEAAENTDTLTVVTTGFPAYDWVKNLAGEDSGVEVRLLGGGVDLHSYQPSVEDIVTISESDLFICVGGASEEWVTDALANAANPDLIAINLMEVLGDRAVAEELVEGMEPEADEDGEELDEHVWLSLRNARLFCAAIADALSELDPDHAERYAANLADYDSRLARLDEAYEEMIGSARQNTLLFGDRFPFRYLVDDYGLSYYAAFAGCSAETEASFATIMFLADKVDELGLGAVLTIETSDQSIARTIVDNTSARDQQVLTLDSMQAVTQQQADGGTTYLAVMEQNLEVIRQALN